MCQDISFKVFFGEFMLGTISAKGKMIDYVDTLKYI